MTPMRSRWRRVFLLTVAGGAGFWLANFAISLTSIAAEYRAALSIAYVPMLVEALVGGLVIGFCVASVLLRLDARSPLQRPVLASVALSVVVLLAVTLVMEVPAKFLVPTTDSPMRYFLIGLAFNVVRILTLGVVIGLLYSRRHDRVEV